MQLMHAIIDYEIIQQQPVETRMTDKQLILETSILENNRSLNSAGAANNKTASVADDKGDGASANSAGLLSSGADVQSTGVDDPKQKGGLLEIGGSLEIGAPLEIGGPRGLEPTRYGDWESKGRCSDF